VQAYNAQAMVDADNQAIVAQSLRDRPTDVTLATGRFRGNVPP
jgi:hypothetical protein